MDQEEKNEIAKLTESRVDSFESPSILMDMGKFEHIQRVAKMLCSSTMVPTIFKGIENMGNCIIALNLSERLRADPLMVMQKMYVIHGKPAMETQLQNALFQRSGKFEELTYHLSGEGASLACYCTAVRISDKKEVAGPTVTMAMAKAEGWATKNGSKWQTMPQLMIHYRASTFFISVHDPGCRMGLITKDEAYDIQSSKHVEAHVTDTTEKLPAREQAAFDAAKALLLACDNIDALSDVMKNADKEEIGYLWSKLDQEYLMCVEDMQQKPVEATVKEEVTPNAPIDGADIAAEGFCQ